MKAWFVLTLMGLIATSCSNKLKYFTQDLYEDFGWTERDLRAIQFYVSEDIVLYKKLSAEEARISKGKIRIVDGSQVEEVIIEQGTPGVFVRSPKQERFAISFEDDASKFLMFGPSDKHNGRFVLLGKEWNKRSGKITYGNEVYETSSSSAYAALMVDINKAYKTKYKSRRAGGKRVD